LRPVAALAGFVGRNGVSDIVPLVLEEDLVGSESGFFTREGVMEMFLLGDRDLMNTLFGRFLECAGHADDTQLSLEMSHNSNGNN